MNIHHFASLQLLGWPVVVEGTQVHTYDKLLSIVKEYSIDGGVARVHTGHEREKECTEGYPCYINDAGGIEFEDGDLYTITLEEMAGVAPSLRHAVARMLTHYEEDRNSGDLTRGQMLEYYPWCELDGFPVLND